ncbi:MAG: SDR family oxidoreductase [Candidatus Omnitrophica bacterium]|nr:SDR family oxidoreductase [Candidatus Omnitrophota bacterium]
MIVIKKNSKILITGASGDIGFALLGSLVSQSLVIGVQSYSNKERLERFVQRKHKARIKIFVEDVASQEGSTSLVDQFEDWAGGIDAVVQLSGALSRPISWEEIDQSDWDRDLAVNLTGPFFLAREAIKRMKSKGGRIILMSTASASHGGGPISIGYGAAKSAVECITKGLAKQAAKYNILVNAIAPGFINTKFHTKYKKVSASGLVKRTQMIPLKRAGNAEDVVGMIMYLLSDHSNYITGEILTISGGDWL